ncbi:hypothetical protein ACUH93_00740 [Dermabacteraceae bacterium P7006]
MSYLDYLKEISDGASNKQISKAIDAHATTIGRWSSSRPEVEYVLRAAKHYGRPVYEGLLAAGYVDEEGVSVRTVAKPLSTYSDDQILDEAMRRVERAKEALKASAPSATITPITSPADYGEDPDISDLPLAAGDVEDDPDLNDTEPR